MDDNATHAPLDPLTLELLLWISSRPRTYADAMEAWRSNCPRHSVWDDAVVDGLVEIVRGDATASQSAVALTARGAALLHQRQRAHEELRVAPAPVVRTL